ATPVDAIPCRNAVSHHPAASDQLTALPPTKRSLPHTPRNSMKIRTLLALFTCLVVATAWAGAADWPQFRGPGRTDISLETGLMKSWPTGGPKLLWTYDEAGIGYAGPAVVGNRLYTMGAKDKTEYVYALDVESGKKIWSTPIAPLFTNGY